MIGAIHAMSLPAFVSEGVKIGFAFKFLFSEKHGLSG
jgi:hypothetical protein